MREIETARLVLRPHAIADFDEVAAMWADPEVVRFIGGVPSTRGESWARLLRYVGHWAALGYGFWAIHDRAGRFAGELGFADFHRDVEPPFDIPEAGWVLASWAHGQGFAREALAAALAWADAQLASDLACVIEPANARSIRLATACGFVETHRTAHGGDELVAFRRYLDRDRNRMPPSTSRS